MQEPPSVEDFGLEEKRRILGWLFANVSAEVQPPPIQLSDHTQT
jgi:hypothetical protein